MSATDSVGVLIARLRCGDEQAAESLWSRYFERLVELARGKLLNTRPVSIDEEDIALESLASLYHGLRSGRFQHIHNRVDLWKLLVVMTLRGVHKAARAADRRRLAFHPAEFASEVQRVVSAEPDPAHIVAFSDTLSVLVKRLDAQLATIAKLRLAGSTTREIASELGIARRSVQRKLSLIQHKWMSLMDEA